MELLGKCKFVLLIRDPYDAIWVAGQRNGLKGITRASPKWDEWVKFAMDRAQEYKLMWKNYSDIMNKTEHFSHTAVPFEYLAELRDHHDGKHHKSLTYETGKLLFKYLGFKYTPKFNASALKLSLLEITPTQEIKDSPGSFFLDNIVCDLWSSHLQEAVDISQQLGFPIKYKPPRGCELVRKKHAVLICGLVQRQDLEDIGPYFVKPLVDRGGQVDVFYSLVNLSSFVTYKGTAADYGVNPPFSVENFHESITSAGGRVPLQEIRNQDFEISEDFRNVPTDLMGYATPKGTHCRGKGILGCSVLRRFACARSLYERATAIQSYDTFSLIREDAGFIDGIRLDMSPHIPEDYHRHIFTRSCCEFFGISDKVLVMGKEAANSLLTKFHDNFYHSEQLVIKKTEKNRSNPELFLRAVMNKLNLNHTRLDFYYLPISDIKRERGDDNIVRRCMRKTYFQCRHAHPHNPCQNNTRVNNERNLSVCNNM